jgi:hypothetical protein
MTFWDCTPFTQASAISPLSVGSKRQCSHINVALTLAVALESSPSTWVSLNIGGRTKQAVYTPRPAFLAECLTDLSGQIDVEGCGKTSRTGKACRGSSVSPCSISDVSSMEQKTYTQYLLPHLAHPTSRNQSKLRAEPCDVTHSDSRDA